MSSPLPAAAPPVRALVPNGRDRRQWPPFCAALNQLQRAAAVEFSFQQVDFVSPGWMLMIANALKSYRDHNPGTRCRVVDTRSVAMGYAGHAGFFDAVGVPWSNRMGEARQSPTFVPVTARTVRDLFKDAPLSRSAGDIVQEDAWRLATLLTQQREGTLFDLASYGIREMMRNVVEHSQSTSFQFAAQCWPAAGLAEIAIADAGIGIAGGLKANRKHLPADDAAALLLATQAGVSGALIPKHSDDAWVNSGFGLYLANGLSDRRDGFLLASGSAALIGGGGKAKAVDASFNGTCVILRLRTGEAPLEKRLKELVAASGGKASGASLSVRVHAGERR